jgi:hypothetical protein
MSAAAAFVLPAVAAAAAPARRSLRGCRPPAQRVPANRWCRGVGGASPHVFVRASASNPATNDNVAEAGGGASTSGGGESASSAPDPRKVRSKTTSPSLYGQTSTHKSLAPCS